MTLTVVTGLPGSGKSHLLNELQATGRYALVVEDFKKDAYHNRPGVRDSRYYDCLIALLRAGKNCLIGDIEFCRAYVRDELVECVRQDAPGMGIEWISFENDPQQCVENVKRRGRANVAEEIQRIKDLSDRHSIPSGARIVAVFTEVDPSQ